MTDDDTWTLTAEQALFMLQHHNTIEATFASGDTSDLDVLVESTEFKALFAGMSFDEAYDRYETMMEQ